MKLRPWLILPDEPGVSAIANGVQVSSDTNPLPRRRLGVMVASTSRFWGRYVSARRSGVYS